jgi:membrane-associated phospholipid phosphatase
VLVNQRRSLIASAGMLAGAVAIGALLAAPATRPWVQAVDDGASSVAVDVRTAPATWVATSLSLIGGVWVNWPLRVAIALLLVARTRWLQLAAFALAVVTSEAAIGTTKELFDRPRPPGSLIETSGDSFPSGHAIAATVTAFWFVIALAPPTPRRWRWGAWAVLFAFAMALSRVYLSAHWLSDVVAGALLGAATAFGWPALLMALTRDEPAFSEEENP